MTKSEAKRFFGTTSYGILIALFLIADFSIWESLGHAVGIGLLSYGIWYLIDKLL